MDRSQIELENKLKERGKKEFNVIIEKFSQNKDIGDILKVFAFLYSDYIEQYGKGLSVEQRKKFDELKFAIIDLSVAFINAQGTKRDLSPMINKTKELFNK